MIWRSRIVTLEVLICLGGGLASVLWSDDPNVPPGYYDGDDDDAAAMPESLDGAVALVADTTGIRLPIPPCTRLGLASARVSPLRPTATERPSLRSPTA